ncbi:MAG: hypothetical protein JRN15_17560 [Nitrososphaerota archaeon]|nr:hypothetical protein [Nitrososphaerota archaeon]
MLKNKQRLGDPKNLNGDRETEGLIEIGLVEYLDDEEKSKKITLSAMGRLSSKVTVSENFRG